MLLLWSKESDDRTREFLLIRQAIIECGRAENSFKCTGTLMHALHSFSNSEKNHNLVIPDEILVGRCDYDAHAAYKMENDFQRHIHGNIFICVFIQKGKQIEEKTKKMKNKSGCQCVPGHVMKSLM